MNQQKKSKEKNVISYVMCYKSIDALTSTTNEDLYISHFLSLHIHPDKTDILVISHEYFTLGFGDIASIADRQDQILKTCFLSLKMKIK